MLKAIELALISVKPAWVLLYGDTNSTLAGALAASKLGLRIAHVETGLRSYRRSMPEEINRVVADHLSDLLCCPIALALECRASKERILNWDRERVPGPDHVFWHSFVFSSSRAVTE